MGYLIVLSAAHRATTGLAGGDPVRVILRLADSPRVVEMPADFSAALDADEAAHRFFDGLPKSLQRYHVDNVNAAKKSETRHRCIDKAVNLFREGGACRHSRNSAKASGTAHGRAFLTSAIRAC